MTSRSAEPRQCAVRGARSGPAPKTLDTIRPRGHGWPPGDPDKAATQRARFGAFNPPRLTSRGTKAERMGFGLHSRGGDFNLDPEHEAAHGATR